MLQDIQTRLHTTVPAHPPATLNMALSLSDGDLGSMGLPILSVWSSAKGGAESLDCSYLPGLQETQSLRGSEADTGLGRLEGPRVASGQGQLEGAGFKCSSCL